MVILNESIKSDSVLLVRASENGASTELMSKEKALELAYELGLDLVQVSKTEGADSEAPVCKLMDYSKYLYEQKKKKAHVVKQDIKEIRLSDSIAENDLKIKAKNVERILKSGDKVRVTITYKGRLVRYINRGVEKLRIFGENIGVNHVVDKEPQVEGNRVYMVLSPKK